MRKPIAFSRGELVPLLLAIFALATPFGTIWAQRFEGVLVEPDRQSPVGNARVWLTRTNGSIVDTARSRADGSFEVKADRAGAYQLVVRRIGFLSEHTDPVELIAGETLRDDVVLLSTAAVPPVKVLASRTLNRFGINLDMLGSRYVDPERMDRIRTGAMDIASMLSRAGIPSLSIRRSGNDGTCAIFRWSSTCAKVYLDGMSVGPDLSWLTPLDIEAMAVVRPLDGGFVDGGVAIMLFTVNSLR